MTAVCAPRHERLSDTTVALTLLLVVLSIAAWRGRGPALVAALLGALSYNFFFLPPLYELTIDDPRNWVALAAFLVTAVVAGQLSELARHRAADAEAGKAAARRACAYNRNLIEASLDAMAAIGPDGKITDVNVAAERLTGRAREDLIGSDFPEWFTEPERARAGHRQALREGYVQNSTLKIRRRDQRTSPVLCSASVYRDEIGGIAGVFAVVRDVGEPATPDAAGADRALWFATVESAPTLAHPYVRPAGGPSAGRHPVVRALIATLPTLATFVVQRATWSILHPFAWFLFYPAVFASSWIGGVSGGILATALSTALVWWFFVPPEHALAKGEPRYLFAAGAFAATGLLFSLLQGRLYKARNLAIDALAAARREHERGRRASDEIARLVEEASDGIFVANRGGYTIDVNGAGCRMLGYDRGELIGLPLAELMPSEDAGRHRRAAEQLVHGGVQIAEFRLRRKDGTYLPVEVSAKVQPDGRWQGIVRDITERKRAEDELRRLNRAHRALSSCNQALIRATDEIALLGQICQIAVDQAGYRFCWVGRAEHDDARTVRPIAQAGFADGYLERAEIRWADDEHGRGPTGTSIREGRPTVVEDIAMDPRMAPWRAEALARGYLSSIAIPLDLGTSARGSMTIYAGERDAFHEEEVALLQELSDDLAYGIMTIRTRAERNRAQEEVRSLNAELEERIATRTAELRASREREAETGGRIQQMLLLDRPPRDVRGLRVAALTVPSQKIAGDFYAFFEHEESDCLDVIVADVMGKGVPAALLGAATKSHFPDALWHLLGRCPMGLLPEPKDVVALAHTHMAQHLIGLESFVTTCYARFDVANQTLALVDCGHTGAIHLRPKADGCTVLHGENLPLGVREGEIYDQIAVPLEVGDVLVFFSDGVTEARDGSGALFGLDRLVECARRNAATDPPTILAAVRDAVTAFAGSRAPSDDLTCVVVQLVPQEVPIARANLEIQSSLGELRRARAFIEAFCTESSRQLLLGEALTSLVLAVHEAATNIVKHAYRGREDQRIDIAAEAFRDRVAVRLRHLGVPFEPSAVPPPSFDGSSESGFGVFMISRSADAVRYYRDDLGRSCIYLEKRRGA